MNQLLEPESVSSLTGAVLTMSLIVCVLML